MPVEFLGIAATNDGSEITARSGACSGKDYTLSLARAREEHGWDRVLFAYGPGSPDPDAAAACIAGKTGTLQLLLARRPDVSCPTFAAKTFATIGQISDGRVTVHFITGGTGQEQQREGDYLSRDERYARTGEYMAIVRQAWTAREPSGHTGPHDTFADFVSDVFPVQAPRPRLSSGGSSPAAYRVGGAGADISCLRGEPLASTAEQIAPVNAAARAAGRADVPKIQVAFRPIIAPAEEKAWAKARHIAGRIEDRVAADGGALSRRRPLNSPENTGSRRLLAIAAEGERHPHRPGGGRQAGRRGRGRGEAGGMKFTGLDLIASSPDATGQPGDPTRRLSEVVDNAVLFEELGFDGFAVGERHHVPFLSSAPPVVLSHIAAVTSKIRLFTGVTLLSVLDPVRVAEDCS